MRVLVLLLVGAVCLASPGWGRFVGSESSGTALDHPSPLRKALQETVLEDSEDDDGQLESSEELLPEEQEARNKRFFGSIWKKVKEWGSTVSGVLGQWFGRSQSPMSDAAEYTVDKLKHARNKAEGRQVLDKLEDTLAHQDDGNIIKRIFKTVGDKIRSWVAKLLNLGRKRQLATPPKMPNFFKEGDVPELVNKLVDHGVLTKLDAETLLEDEVESDEDYDKK